jgi:iron complex transport system substrate-binding protein
MRLVDVINGLALLCALTCALWSVALVGGGHRQSAQASTSPHDGADQLETLVSAGRCCVRDARGTAIPLGGYMRIASLSVISDALLLELCEPQRVVAFSTYTRGMDRFRLGTTPRLKGLDDIEEILALHPDLVFCTPSRGERDRVERLRAAGVTVCDLGDDAGLFTLEHAARLCGLIIGAPERAQHFCSSLKARMAAVAAGLPAGRAHRRGLVVLMVGDSIYGGTLGTSYHDVLTAAGVIDVAATRYHGWPSYHIEDLITLDPEVIITTPGTGERLRRLPALASLRALHMRDGVIEVDDDLLSDPGPHMLDAAEAVYKAAYH